MHNVSQSDTDQKSRGALWDSTTSKVTPVDPTFFHSTLEEVELQSKQIDLERQKAKLAASQVKTQPGTKLDPEVYEQLMKDSEPLWLTDKMVERPCWFILGGYSILIVMGIIAFSLDYFKMDPGTGRDMFIWDDPRTFSWDKMIVGEEYILGGGSSDEEKPLRMTQINDYNPLISYSARDGGNLISRNRLIKIRDLEARIKSHDRWTKTCAAASTTDTSCSPTAFVSVLNFLPMAGMLEPIETYTDEQLREGFANVKANPQLWGMLQLLFEKEEIIDANDGRVTHMRSFMSFGLPLDVEGIRYKSLTDRRTDQEEYLADFQMDLYDELRELKDDEEAQPQILSFLITMKMVTRVANGDTLWAVCSVFFVFCFFIVKLRSAFLGIFGILIILLSFAITQVLSEGVFRNTYFSPLHNIVIFIVLGIGADDIFVYTDGYSQTKNIPEIEGDRRRRVAYAFKRAARATATTSSTTSIAFLANAFSDIMPIQSFGIFASVIIASIYALGIFIYPSVVIWWEDNLEGRWCPCQDKPQVGTSQVHKLTEDGEIELGRVERFFGGPWNKFVYTFRIPIIVLAVIWVSFSLVFATKLTALTKQEQYLSDEHPVTIMSELQKDKFMSGGLFNLAMDIFWGVKDIDKSDVSMWDPYYIGDVIMDDKFDLSSPEAQQSLLDFCEDLAEQDFVQNRDVTCWMQTFKAYVESQGSTLPIQDPKEFDTTLYKWATEVPEGMQAQARLLIGFVDKKLVFTKVKSTSKGNALDPYDLKNPFYEKWEEYMTAYRAKAPASMRSVDQTAGQWWALMPTERAFLSSAFQGMAIAICFAFIVLLAATTNIIQASISLFCVVSIMISVLGIMKMQDWEIGSAESLAMVILIGFSVDYVVHLSADFMHSAHHKRFDKMRQAYTEMGVSVMSGAIVTFGSGIFLFGGDMIFFNKFALLITSTITLSFLASMLLFGALMHTFGPEENFGSILCPSQKTTKK